MLRRIIAGAGATALLVAALLTGITPAADAQRDYKPWGRAASHDHVLRHGCHSYRYHYRINAPTDYWSAEIFLVNPNGVGLAANAIDTNSDPDRGHERFLICKPSTTYGVHRIKMKVTYCAEADCRGRMRDGFVKPTRFRFTRPG